MANSYSFIPWGLAISSCGLTSTSAITATAFDMIFWSAKSKKRGSGNNRVYCSPKTAIGVPVVYILCRIVFELINNNVHVASPSFWSMVNT